MSARSFRSVFMVASCAGAALGCYLVSLHVASERAALQQVEDEIVLAQREIRLLETEIGTRGRLAQLERWNVRVLALSAPSADQFVEGEFALASLMKPGPKMELEAPVVLASAHADDARPQLVGSEPSSGPRADESATARELLHVASLKRPVRDTGETAERLAKRVTSAPAKKDEPGKSIAATSAEKKAGDKPAVTASKSVTKPAKAAKTAKVDPLAPLPVASSNSGKEIVSAR